MLSLSGSCELQFDNMFFLNNAEESKSDYIPQLLIFSQKYWFGQYYHSLLPHFMIEKKVFQWLVSFFFFFSQTHFANFEFVHFVSCPLRFLTLKHYIAGHIDWSVLVSLKITTARSQMTMSHILGA